MTSPTAGPERGGPSAESDAAFTQNTHNAHVLWEAIKNTTLRAVDSAYGTDPRHGLLAYAVADEVAFGRPLPWGLGSHFGRVTPPADGADGITPPRSVFQRFSDAFDERQRPVCGVWNPMLGPCVCGNPEGHVTPPTDGDPL